MDQEQNPELIAEKVEELQKKTIDLCDKMLNRSALHVAREMKRFAKTNRLAIPYVFACFLMANESDDIFETVLGIDNAMEMIAYLEDPEKMKRLQNDYDVDTYEYYVHRFSACAYDNLAILSGERHGYNSPIVHGAVDDGIQVCRRTGKLECVQCFREYATIISLASGDYEMGEYYARICATSAERQNSDDRSYIGFKNLIELSILQGKFQAAFDYFDDAWTSAKQYHSPLRAKTELAILAERLYWLAGREDEFPAFLSSRGYGAKIDIPSWEENSNIHLKSIIAETVKLARQNRFEDALKIIADYDLRLLAMEAFTPWADVRIARIATLRLARQSGAGGNEDLERLESELRERAVDAHHWSAIRALDSMAKGTLPLNPLGIVYPIDIGPYAMPGTPRSSAHLELTLPLVSKEAVDAAKSEDSEDSKERWLKDAEVEIGPFFQEANERGDKLESLYKALRLFEYEKESKLAEGGDVSQEIFPQRGEISALENEVCSVALSVTPETNPTLNPFELHSLIRALFFPEATTSPETMAKLWKWFLLFKPHFKETARYQSTMLLLANTFRKRAQDAGVDPASLGLPAAQAVVNGALKEGQRHSDDERLAVIVGIILRDNDRPIDAQYYFARACQLDRLDGYALRSLVELYIKADRPKEAVAAIDLYCRAGGREPYFLFTAMHLTITNEMPHAFLLYFSAFQETDSETILPFEMWRLKALMETQQYGEALKTADQLSETFEGTPLDLKMLQTHCLLLLRNQKWLESFDTVLRLIHERSDGEYTVGFCYEPCVPLWEAVRTEFSESDERRILLEQFMLERGIVPQEYFKPVVDENETGRNGAAEEKDESAEPDEFDEDTLMTLWLGEAEQRLDPSVPAYSGWTLIPPETPFYRAQWYIAANDEEEARRLLLEWQGKCYSAAPCSVVSFEEVGKYPYEGTGIAAMGPRMPPEEDESES